MSDCLFCKISAGEIPADLVYEGDDILAFRDIHPQAPTHILIIPRKHIDSMNEAQTDDAALLGRILLAARHIAAEQGVGPGYRLVNNCGAQAGQTVMHWHLHLLGGRSMGWPPG